MYSPPLPGGAGQRKNRSSRTENRFDPDIMVGLARLRTQSVVDFFEANHYLVSHTPSGRLHTQLDSPPFPAAYDLDKERYCEGDVGMKFSTRWLTDCDGLSKVSGVFMMRAFLVCVNVGTTCDLRFSSHWLNLAADIQITNNSQARCLRPAEPSSLTQSIAHLAPARSRRK